MPDQPPENDLSKYQVDIPPEIAGLTPVETPKKQLVDPKLPQRATRAIRAILQGNGVHPDQVTLGDFDLRMLPFTGALKIKLEAKVAKKQVPGKSAKGDVVADEASLFAAVDKHIQRIMVNPPQRKPMFDIVLKRPDKGFAFDDKKLGFHAYTTQFVMYDGCQTCAKSGKVVCNICQGRMQVPCTTCRGQKEVFCPSCKGDRIIRDQRGDYTCQKCRGRGRIPCQACGADGLIDCKTCLKTGRIKCLRCTGTGWMTTLLVAECEAHYKFVLEHQGLPPPVITAMIEQGPKLIERSIAEIEVAGTQGPEDSEKLPKDELSVFYKGILPYGAIRFQVGAESIGAMMFGFHGDLLECPPFLERIGADAITRLLGAAEKPKEAYELLPHAARSRFIREALQAGLMSSRAKAIESYKKRYPYGLSDQMIRDLLALAEAATRNASRDFRLYAVLGSMAVITLMTGAYYIGPGLALVVPHLPNVYAQMGMDAALTLVLMGLAYQFPRLAGAFALKRILGSVMPVNRIRSIMPKAGYLEWCAVAAVPLISAAFIMIAKNSGALVPAWMAWIGL
jgi:hypothetical protein